MATSPAYSYHCICTTLILATKYDLDALPVRAQPALDHAIVLPLKRDGENEKHTSLHNLVHERKPVVIRREDGFEKRTALRCERCNVVVGYQLSDEQFSETEDVKAEDVVYILPGGLVSTEDMKAGKMPPTPDWAQQVA